MFKSKYVSYVIVTPLKGFSVERRYSDFLALRQEMLKDYPGYVIPPIPAKKIAGNADPAFIQERKGELQEFLADVLKHPLIKSYDLFLKFISVSNKEWEDTAKTFGKLLLAKEINQYETIEGEAKLLFSDRTRDYCEKLGASTKDLREAFKDLKAIHKVIIADVEKLAFSVARASVIYQKISSIFNTLEDKTHAELFLHMSDGHSRLAGSYKMEFEEMSAHFGEFYSFYANEVGALEELVQKRKSTGESMESTEKKLYKKKEQKYEQRNTQTWELDPADVSNIGALINDKALAFQLMLPKESEEARKLRMYYGYLSNKIVEEFNRLQSKNEGIYKDHFVKAAECFVERKEKFKQIWTDMTERLKNVMIVNLNKNKEVPELATAPIATDIL